MRLLPPHAGVAKRQRREAATLLFLGSSPSSRFLMENDKKIYEGKTKIVYDYSKSFVRLYFKDDITAGDGAKHDTKTGIGELSWQVSTHCFSLLNRNSLPTHYINSGEKQYITALRMDTVLPLEVVVRRVATGSLLGRTLYNEGDYFEPTMVEFFVKCDMLHDPLIDSEFAVYTEKKYKTPYGDMEELSTKAFLILEKAFAHHKYQLIDLKLEFGMRNQVLHIIDDITPGSFRLWPYTGEKLLPQKNVFDQLDKDGMKDKQLYRNGKDLDTVIAAYKFVAELTGKFI